MVSKLDQAVAETLDSAAWKIGFDFHQFLEEKTFSSIGIVFQDVGWKKEIVFEEHCFQV